ncbi:MATE family efflux transporter [Polymorphum gilvum]|uniref:Putative transmembrane protein n=1 Tax=Polymorphum gilvum (strain LMG 25793 / CGMCC 1.9160 / SL003B-26A1) TaxID=991905 RepID=F2IY74_POLGS|nr:MATE family efflux transporter [Polymorphum gilvum]ADZ71686.1 Putative transmembrane protein [Polymorphum gilvum SL003B-26A1]
MTASSERAFAVTHRSVLAIAVPMTLAYLSTPILGIVDTAVIGQLGDAALVGGIAVASVLFDLVFTTFNFLRSGTTGLTAQALGSGNQQEMRATVLRALAIAVVSGLAVVALQRPLLGIGLSFLGGSAAVQSAASSYFEIRVYSAPFLLANYAILGWFLGLGRAGTGLMLQTVLNGLNIALSVWFVIGQGWGIPGVALATVISEIAACLLGGLLVMRATRGGTWPSRAVLLDRAEVMRVVAVNRDIMIRSFSLLFAFAFFTARSADQGDVILAANAILEKFFLVGGYFLDGFATAAEQLAGRAVGARHRPAFDRALRLTMVWGFVMAGVLAAFYALAGPLMIDLMTTAPQVRDAARIYLVWAALTPVAGVLAFQMDGVFIGATWSRDMRNMMLLSLALFLCAFWLLFPVLGNHGLWLALEIFLLMRGFSLYFVCRRRAAQTFAAAARPAA